MNKQLKYIVILTILSMGQIIETTIGKLTYKTFQNSCISCYTRGNTHCLKENLIDSECSEHEEGSLEQKQWMSKFKYCTTNLKSNLYKIQTCPGSQCPNNGKPKIVTLSEYDKEQMILQGNEIDNLRNAYHCKIQIKAQEGLNGKIVLDFISEGNENIQSFIYLQPNNLQQQNERGTHGIIENNMIYFNRKSRVYEAPADWTISLRYNIGTIGNTNGKFQLKAKLQKYDIEDLPKIKKYWQPTKTHYVEDQSEKLRKDMEKLDKTLDQLDQIDEDIAQKEKKRQELIYQAEKEKYEILDENKNEAKQIKKDLIDGHYQINKNQPLNLIQTNDNVNEQKYNEKEGKSNLLVILIIIISILIVAAVMGRYAFMKQEQKRLFQIKIINDQNEIANCNGQVDLSEKKDNHNSKIQVNRYIKKRSMLKQDIMKKQDKWNTDLENQVIQDTIKIKLQQIEMEELQQKQIQINLEQKQQMKNTAPDRLHTASTNSSGRIDQNERDIDFYHQNNTQIMNNNEQNQSRQNVTIEIEQFDSQKASTERSNKSQINLDKNEVQRFNNYVNKLYV